MFHASWKRVAARRRRWSKDNLKIRAERYQKMLSARQQLSGKKTDTTTKTAFPWLLLSKCHSTEMLFEGARRRRRRRKYSSPPSRISIDWTRNEMEQTRMLSVDKTGGPLFCLTGRTADKITLAHGNGLYVCVFLCLLVFALKTTTTTKTRCNETSTTTWYGSFKIENECVSRGGRFFFLKASRQINFLIPRGVFKYLNVCHLLAII